VDRNTERAGPRIRLDTAAVHRREGEDREAKGAPVSYSVSAVDATDGPVATSCLPKSGSRFRIGRKTVTCTTVDGSGNVATASFVITVKRLRR
jgi:hypothetical protein